MNFYDCQFTFPDKFAVTAKQISIPALDRMQSIMMAIALNNGDSVYEPTIANINDKITIYLDEWTPLKVLQILHQSWCVKHTFMIHPDTISSITVQGIMDSLDENLKKGGDIKIVLTVFQLTANSIGQEDTTVKIDWENSTLS